MQAGVVPLQEACDAAADGMLLVGRDGRIVCASAAACEIFRTTRDTLYRVGADAITNLEDPRSDGVRGALCDGRSVAGVTLMVRPDGSDFVADISASVFASSPGGDQVFVVIRDVTRRIRRERRLVAYEEISQALLSGAETSTVLDLVARHACAVFDATFSCIVTPTSTGTGSGSSPLMGKLRPT